VYIAVLPDVMLGKFGLTQNTSDRHRTLRAEYGPNIRIVYNAVSENAPQIEKEMRSWLESKSALRSEKTVKGKSSKETFDLNIVSIEEACNYMSHLVAYEEKNDDQTLGKKTSLVEKEAHKILLNKLKEDNVFALQFYSKQLEISEKEKTIHEIVKLWSVEKQQKFLFNIKWVSSKTTDLSGPNDFI
jgi:hypothetical protein